MTENGLTVQALARKARKPGAGMNSKLVTTRNVSLYIYLCTRVEFTSTKC